MNCSIIIPTHNRPDYLKRVLSYYGDYGGNIIVADSSPDKVLNRECVSTLPSIQYYEHSPETDISQKIIDALNYVKTKYCVFCADDDFVTPNGINQATNFLENNPDFTTAQGHYIWFWSSRNQQFPWMHGYLFQSITFPKPEERLKYHLSHYFIPTFYAVHRTDFLRMLFGEVAKFTDDVRFGELLPSMLALIYGKMKCLDVLYAARESIATSVGMIATTFNDFIQNGTYEKKYARFRECLSTHLNQQSQLDIEEAGKTIDAGMAAYLIKYRNPVRKRLFMRHNIDVSPTSKHHDDYNKIRLCVLSH